MHTCICGDFLHTEHTHLTDTKTTEQMLREPGRLPLLPSGRYP